MLPTVCSATPCVPHFGQRSVGSVGAGTWMGMPRIYEPDRRRAAVPMSKKQRAVDLGEHARGDESAWVTPHARAALVKAPALAACSTCPTWVSVIEGAGHSVHAHVGRRIEQRRERRHDVLLQRVIQSRAGWSEPPGRFALRLAAIAAHVAALALVSTPGRGVAEAPRAAGERQAPLDARRHPWSLAEAARPYRGVTITASFLPRPGYEAAIQLIPEFERLTGITVRWESIYYEQMREALVLDFTRQAARFDVVLVDVVWLGEFASAGWVLPLSRFTEDPALADPELQLDDFFPILLSSFGTWDAKLYGLPFDNYSGLLFYDRCALRTAGFNRPPETWQELKDVYGPALTGDGRYAFALQSHRGETQSCDSFLRFVWPFGGSLLTSEFQPNLSSRRSLEGLRFRQELMRYMPPDVVDMDHEETVQALASGRAAMITEWSGWYKWLAAKKSRIADCLGVALEPAGPAGRMPALGGFSLGVNAHSPPPRQAAAWLLIQWLTSKQKAREYILAGGVPGRRSAYRDAALKRQFPYFEALVTSWDRYGNAAYRPRFQEWPAISRIVSTTGADMMLGRIDVEEGAKRIDDQVRYILYESGYYGAKPKLR